MASGNQIDVTVVVGGKPVPVSVNSQQKVEQLIREGLNEAKQNGAKPEDWVLRTADGREFTNQGQRVRDAGIVTGVTLYLDPKEGGGGNVPTLVDPAVSTAKLDQQLTDWEANAETYRQRGWLLLDHRGLELDIGFMSRLPIGSPAGLPAIPLCVRINFDNYDIWAPSVILIDAMTREPIAEAPFKALDFRPQGRPLRPGELPENSLIGPHPIHDRVFLCKRGVREYHDHPEHTGDDWLLYRGQGLGTLSAICTMLWRLVARNISGFDVHVRQLPAPAEGTAFGLLLHQEDAEAVAANIAQQIKAAEAEARAQMQAQFEAMQRQQIVRDAMAQRRR
jgi:hypothetical protein